MMSGELQNEIDAAQSPAWLRAVYDYHARSKHRFSGYARGPAALDWDAQPNPFRVYADTQTVELPIDELSHAAIPPRSQSVSYADALNGGVEPRAISLSALAQLLRLAFGITAWKELPDGARWALRANPSSGNLHPSEVWVIVGGWPSSSDENLKNGLYHYDCRNHALQLRCEWPNAESACPPQPELHIALSTIYWREAWKYGERAFRYCHLDIGHAAAALGFACATLGWRADRQIFDSDAMDEMLGLTRAEHQTVEQESAACVFQIRPQNHPIPATPNAPNLPAQARALNLSKAGAWRGQPNRLDSKPLYTWAAIERIAAATRALSDQPAAAAVSEYDISARACTEADLDAEWVIRERRSAQAYDGSYQLSLKNFSEMLDAFFENRWQPLLRSEARIHLVFAVHRVGELTPGLYVLPRSARGEALMRQELRRWSDWEGSGMTFADRTLYRIKSANAQRAAATLCCQQSIAGDCSFVTGFLAEFDGALGTPSAYCALYQEAGALAHAAYLRATALGLAGTGIGCFFDDEWHELLGIDNTSLQFLYHFAAGKPQHDARIAQRAGYFHLHRRRFS